MILGLSAGARAEVLFYEGFNYPLTQSWPPAGTSLQNVSAWQGAEAQPDSFGVVEGLSYPDSAAAGRAAGRSPGLPGPEPFTSVHQNVPALQGVFSTAGTFYVSVLFRERVGMTIGDQSFNASHQRTGVSNGISIQFETPGGAASNYFAALQVTDASGEIQDVNDTLIPLGETNVHMLAVKVENDGAAADDVVSMVLDPDLSAGEPFFAGSVWRVSNQNITATNVEVYLYPPSGGDETVKAWDEIRVGATWADMVPPMTTAYSLVTLTNAAVLTFPSMDDCRYRLELSTSIASAAWTDAGYEITGNSGKLTAYDPTGAGGKAYRLSVSPPPVPATRYAQWQRDRPFTLGTWYGDSIFGPGHGKDGVVFPTPPPLTTYPSMTTFQEAGLNCLVDCTISNGGHDHYPGVSNAQAAGVPFMVRTPGDWGGPWDFETFKTFVQYLAGDPSWTMLWGIQVADEPHGEDGLTDVEAAQTYGLRRDWLVESYPRLLVTVGEALGSGNNYLVSFHRGLLNNIVTYIRPDAIIFQFYPAHWTASGDLHGNYYVAMDYASEFCKTNGVGFWIYPQTAFRNKPYSDSTLRLEKFAALAYGVTGYEDFGYDLNTLWPTRDQEQGYVKVVPDGMGSDIHVKTTAFPLHAQINTEIARLGNVLVTVRHVRAYHVNAVPNWDDGSFTWNTHLFTEQDGLRTGNLQDVTSAGNNLVVGFFRDDSDREYFLVVNKNHDPALAGTDPALQESVTLTLAPGIPGVYRVNRTTGAVEFLPADGSREVSFVLPGGTGDLFRYDH